MRGYLIVGLMLLSACKNGPESRAEALLRQDMMDPEAAKFRAVKAVGDGHCVVGEVNGKNRLGTYSGFRPFIVDLRTNLTAMAPMNLGLILITPR